MAFRSQSCCVTASEVFPGKRPFSFRVCDGRRARRDAGMMWTSRRVMAVGLVVMTMAVAMTDGDDETNLVYGPCWDTEIQRDDGFTFGLAFSSKESFFFNQTQLSPCDRRLGLSASNAKLAVFRPKVDEISLLTINSTDAAFTPDVYGGYMVAFAGRKYASRSLPAFVANSEFIVTSFTLVLEFQKGILQNLYWKQDGCAACSGETAFICVNHTNCGFKTSDCTTQGGAIACNLGIQLAFSGTDKNDAVLNSWYEVAHLRQYSLFNLYSDLRNSITDQYRSVFK